jgi:hypothetical protein
MEEISSVIKATFKAKSKRQLDYILQSLRKIFGQQNINALSPTYICRAKIYILDMDIRIPETLLRYEPDFKATKTDSGGTE